MKTLLLEPLTAEEKDDFRSPFNQQLDRVKVKTADVFRFKDLKNPPFLVMRKALVSMGGLE